MGFTVYYSRNEEKFHDFRLKMKTCMKQLHNRMNLRELVPLRGRQGVEPTVVTLRSYAR